MTQIAMYYLTKTPEIKEEFLEDIYSVEVPFYIKSGDSEPQFGYWKLGQRAVKSSDYYVDYWECEGVGSIEYKPESLFLSSKNNLMIAYRTRIKYPLLNSYPDWVLGNNGRCTAWSTLAVRRLSSFKKMVSDGWRYEISEVDEDDLKSICQKIDANLKQLPNEAGIGLFNV